MQAGEALAAGALAGDGSRVQGQESQRREEELGEVLVAEDAAVPEGVAGVGDDVEEELDSADGDLPAGEEAEVAADDVDGVGGEGEALEVEDGVELGEEGDDEALVGVLG